MRFWRSGTKWTCNKFLSIKIIDIGIDKDKL